MVILIHMLTSLDLNVNYKKKKYLNRIEPFGPPVFVAYKLKKIPINKDEI